MKSKLTVYQKAVKDTKAEQIVLRWGRRVGKDYLVDHISGENDIVMYPTMVMARMVHRKLSFEGRTQSGARCISDPRQLMGFKVDNLFIIEPALHADLYEVLHYVRKVLPQKIYLLGTPMPSEHILTSSFLFNAITRECNALTTDKIFFSLVGASQAPHIDVEAIKEWKREMPEQFVTTELEAEFKD